MKEYERKKLGITALTYDSDFIDYLNISMTFLYCQI
jgi:hypothetical protein